MHIYLYGVSINRMLISQLKRFLGVKFIFPHRFNVNLAFISDFYAVVIRIIMFQMRWQCHHYWLSHHCSTSQTYSQSQAHSHCDITHVT